MFRESEHTVFWVAPLINTQTTLQTRAGEFPSDLADRLTDRVAISIKFCETLLLLFAPLKNLLDLIGAEIVRFKAARTQVFLSGRSK